jgi:hypothetical protein
MGEMMHSEPSELGGKVMPIRANDPPLVVAAQTVWNRMIENHSLDVKRACEETDVPRWQFYEALKSDVVQTEVAKWLDVMRAMEAKLVTDNWFGILSYQIDIAQGKVGDPRTAVQAARFLDGVRQRVQEQNPGKSEEREDAAKLFLEEFAKPPTRSRYRAKRSRKTGPGETVTEELTVEGFSPGNGGETIEG